MSEKQETTFSKRLHKKLDSSIYVEKTSNSWRKGVPDFYYESAVGILWAEHKWISKPWSKDLSADLICRTTSWPLQRQWLGRAYKNNKRVRVIVGVGLGRDTRAYVLEYPFSFSASNNELRTLNEVAEVIHGLLF